MKPACEVFLLGDTEGPVLYAPLHDLSARLNEAAANVVERFLDGGRLDADGDALIRSLSDYGFFSEAEAPQSAHTGKPTQVTLFLSDGCNLRCRYCYANAGARHHVLPLDIGKAAIDRVIGNACEMGSDDFLVGFHGNGEPFTGFSRMRELCEYASNRGESKGKTAKFSVATNGVLSGEKLDFLLTAFDGVNVSFDGLPDLQDRQRPLADGGGSFAAVDRVLRSLNGEGRRFGIRATVTSEGVGRLEEIVSFVSENYPHCNQLHVEPAWECGRCAITGEEGPDEREFLNHYLCAMDAAGQYGLDLTFSAARRGVLSDAFCGVNDDGFTVTATGEVTACFEVCDGKDPRAGKYIYGAYDRDSDEFVFDEGKRAALHRLSVHNMPYCADCFCKYHCAGDCAAKVLGTAEPECHSGSSRCVITRAITRKLICDRVRTAEKLAEETGREKGSIR